jgi:hypothetical protein
MTDTPEGGVDPHRDDWVPVPLTLKTYNRESKTYTIEFEAPKQLLLMSNFEAMVHDEILRNADRDGLMLEGQVVITNRDKGTAPRDVTEAQDTTVHEVLKHPEKEAEVEVEQDKIDSPYKMSDAEIAFRKRQRESLRQTGAEALGFVQRHLDGAPLPEGKQFKVDREAFLDGFFGGGVISPPPREVMVVHVEAMVAMDSGLLADDTVRAEHAAEDDIEAQVADVEIPDDLSGLDG